MNKAIITIEDDGDGVKVNVDFGDGGINEDSSAHYLAVEAIKRIGGKVSELMKPIEGAEQ